MNITEFVGLRPKSYFYLIADASSDTHATKVDEKTKRTKKCVMKTILVFNDCKKCFLRNEIILKSHQRFKSESYNHIHMVQVLYMVLLHHIHMVHNPK